MKHVIKFYIQVQFVNPSLCEARIPLVPILGETYQAETDSGERLYLEATSHYPPTCHFQLEDKEKTFNCHGHNEFKAMLNGLNSLKGWKEGKFTIEFKDGCIYTIGNPLMIVNGLITGSTTTSFIEHCYIRDETNRIEADLVYNPTSDNSYSGMVKRGVSSWGKLAKKLSVGINEEEKKK